MELTGVTRGEMPRGDETMEQDNEKSVDGAGNVRLNDGLGVALNTRHADSHKAADAFWKYWEENGETHKHGYYESTWGAINAALRMVGVAPHGDA
jgi:hypothetical protein